MTVTEQTTGGEPMIAPRFGFRRVFNDTAALTLRAPLLVPAIVGSFILQVAVAAVTFWTVLRIGGVSFDDGIPAILAVIGFFGAILFLFASALLSNFLIHRASGIVDGQDPSFGEGLAVAVRYVLPAFGGTLLVLVLIGLGFVALIVPGIYLAGLFSVFLAVIVVEGRPRGFLKRTRELTRGYRWTLAGLMLLVYVLTSIVSTLFDLLGGAAGDGLLATVFYLAVSAVGIGISLAAVCAAIVLTHRRLVEIKEGTVRPGLARVFE